MRPSISRDREVRIFASYVDGVLRFARLLVLRAGRCKSDPNERGVRFDAVALATNARTMGLTANFIIGATRLPSPTRIAGGGADIGRQP